MELRTYTFQEGFGDTIRRTMPTIAVVDENGQLVGRVVRGEIEGCERARTFRWETPAGERTQIGVRKMTARSVVGRLLRPSYAVTHSGPDSEGGPESDESAGVLKDRIGENILYFAVEGTVDSHRVVILEDWDGTVVVEVRPPRARKIRIGRFSSGGLLSRTRVQVDEDAVQELCPGQAPADTVLFGLLILMPYIHRVYTEETGLIEELLG
ncbi:hypothetical protein M3D92_02400 [Micrococcus terreus]|uniref:hypothetical protein n=1 Tax=Micrococcus terreus TaxID=574650 RepID=UPI0021A8DE97|nr:hypothetical protein [Micrococcus terreus]MCT2088150.1 hypothetical protein [Micrococcus terreus]MDK7700800.1 hypothetical protein [Micrococcus terreus]WOO96958.1 hypothetical protein R3I42_10570 [Micrococcus terreus]